MTLLCLYATMNFKKKKVLLIILALSTYSFKQKNSASSSSCFAWVAKSVCLLQFCFLDCSFQCNAHHMLWFPGISSFGIIWDQKTICLSFSLITIAYFCIIFFLISLSLQCHVSCVPVFDSMSRREIKPWGVVVTLSMLICLFVYTGTGIINVCTSHRYSIMHHL